MIYIHLDGGGGGGGSGGGNVSFELINNAEARPEQRAVAGLGGGLLRSRSSFAYFFLVALEAGSPLRALLLLLSLPLVWLLGLLVLHPDEASIRVFTFVSMAGLRASAVECVARAVLPKAILDDVHPRAYKLLTSCSSRFIVTSTPAIMVEHFVTRYLGAELLAAPKLQVTRSGFCTGFLLQPAVVDKARAIRDRFGGNGYPEVGIGDAEWDHEFLSLCKRAYVVGKGAGRRAGRLPKSDYLAPLIFHDGRLVHRPTPLWALTLMLWLPIGIVLMLLRSLVALCLPKRLALPLSHLLGVSIRVSGHPPDGGDGVLFVLPHRTLVDPVFLSFALGRDVAAVTYSLSRVSELLSPIRTVRLTRRRDQDAARMESMLRQGPLAVCPEGTTCREPYLLRFSPLFAEMTDRIAPVALSETTPVFYATSARGWKCLDGVFFLMNPVASYTIRFLPLLPRHMTCTGGGSHASADVANHVQRVIASSMGYTCTSLTRRDKYRVLAGNDGTVPESTCTPLP